MQVADGTRGGKAFDIMKFKDLEDDVLHVIFLVSTDMCRRNTYIVLSI